MTPFKRWLSRTDPLTAAIAFALVAIVTSVSVAVGRLAMSSDFHIDGRTGLWLFGATVIGFLAAVAYDRIATRLVK